MSTFEAVITLCIFAASLVIVAYYVATLKAELKHTRERLEKLEAAQDKPVGYKLKAGIDDSTAVLIGALKSIELAIEKNNAIKSGRYRPQPDDW